MIKPYLPAPSYRAPCAIGRLNVGHEHCTFQGTKLGIHNAVRSEYGYRLPGFSDTISLYASA